MISWLTGWGGLDGTASDLFGSGLAWYHEPKDLVEPNEMSPQRRETGTANQEDMIGVHELTMTTMENNRRSQARGQMLQTHNENLELMRKNAQLREENEELMETIKSVSSLARTTLIRSDALRKTVEHLRSVWKEDAPDSAKRQEVDQGVPQFFKKTYEEASSDPEVSARVEKEIAATKDQAKINSRSRRPR